MDKAALRLRMKSALFTLRQIETESGSLTPVKVGDPKVKFTSVGKRIKELCAAAKKHGISLK